MLVNNKKKFYFIVNPIAGKANNIRYASAIQVEMDDTQTECETIATKAKGQAQELVEQLLPLDETETIVSVGGDGTFNDIATAMLYKNSRLAIVPRGSGNGLAHMINIPNHRKSLAKYLQTGETLNIDAGRINQHHFFCTCGFGFDAHIASAFNKGTRRGGNRYVKQVMQKLLTYTPVDAEFTMDGKAYDGKFFLVTFSNANQYGNNFLIAPEADLTDGLLHVTILRPFPQVLAPFIATALIGGFIDKMPYIETRTVRKAEIKHVSSPCFHCDGETLDMDYPAKLEVLPSAIRLLAPQNWQKKAPTKDAVDRANKLMNSVLAEIEKIKKQIPHIP